MKLQEAINVLKKIKDWVYLPLYSDPNSVKEAIDTVVAEVEKPLPTDEEINKEIENALPFSEEYQKHSDREKLFMVAATKAGAKWMRDLIQEKGK